MLILDGWLHPDEPFVHQSGQEVDREPVRHHVRFGSAVRAAREEAERSRPPLALMATAPVRVSREHRQARSYSSYLNESASLVR